MLKKHFEPYKDVILRCIKSCVTTEQLQCCNDMVDRFKEVFQFTDVDEDEKREALEQIGAEYLQKHHELHIH